MVSDRIKFYRQLMGYTQMELAYLSTISLPSIQNIESKKANPSLDTLERIFNILNIDVQLAIKPVDWNMLSALGIPVTATVRLKHFILTSEKLIEFLKKACLSLKYTKDVDDRKKEAIEATLVAIRDHYPTLFFNKIKKSSLLLEFCPTTLTGRHIKLRRQALSALSGYL